MEPEPKKFIRRKAVAPVPATALANEQLHLFQSVLANAQEAKGELSNAIDLWDATPRYSVSRTRMNELRTPEGFLPVQEIPFQYRGHAFTAVIYPAPQVKGKDGKRKSFYPSAREELVEHALRKISAEQHHQEPGTCRNPTHSRKGLTRRAVRRRRLASRPHQRQGEPEVADHGPVEFWWAHFAGEVQRGPFASSPRRRVLRASSVGRRDKHGICQAR